MAGGEITKISYEGEEYAKVAGEAKEGDVLLRVSSTLPGQVTVGEYYPALSRKAHSSSRTRYIDEDGDKVSAISDLFEVFRKINASQSDGCALSEKVGELDKRVTALESGEDIPKYKTERRAAKVGERILITDATQTDGLYANGDVLTVIHDDAGFREGTILSRGIEQLIYVCEYEVIVEETTNEPLKVGDYAVVSSRGSKLDGQVVEVRKEDAIAFDFRCYNLRGSYNELYDAHELRKATPAEVAKAKASAIKEGDIVVITANTNHSRNKVGDIGKVGPIYSFDGGANVDVPSRPDSTFSNGNFTNMDEMRLATAQERAQYEREFAAANKPKLKAGDYVKFAHDSRDVTAGKAYEVREDSDGDLYFIDDDSDRRYTALKYNECVKVEEPARTFKKGDIVRLKVSSGADEAGTVVEVLMDGGYGYRRLGRGGDRYGGKPEWYELVAPVESRADRV